MGLAGQNQVRHMYVGTANVADLTALKAGSANSLVILGADGAAVAAGKAFKLYQKDALGSIISSDTIKPDNVLDVRSVAYTAATPKVVTISALTVDVGTLYTVNIEIQGHGSLSPEDTYLKQGYYKAVTGATQETIVDGLIASLNRNFTREIGSTASTNRSFTFIKGFGTQTIDVDTAPTADASASVNVNGTDYTVALLDADTDQQAAAKIAAVIDAIDGVSAAAVATSIVTITSDTATQVTYDPASTGTTVTAAQTASTAGLIVKGKLDAAGFDGDKKIKVYDDFTVDIACTTYPTVTVTTTASKGSGTGYQVVEMERYLLGERGDTYRESGYPHNINGPALVSSASGSYDIIEISYFDEGRDEAKKSKKSLTIAIPTAAIPNANVNSVVADLNTILGASSVATIKAS